MESSKEQFIGNPCGHHGPYTFYKAFKFHQGNKCRILTLGEFFFVKICDEAPVCIGELQLLWEDKNNSQLLSSVRLYYLPEHTPDGRQGYHGKDEVLAVSEKIILRLDDLVLLIEEGVCWNTGTVPVCDNDITQNEKPGNLTKSFAANNCGLEFKDVTKEKERVDNADGDSTDVTILSYTRYCRYRTAMKRLEGVEDQWLQNALLTAIGGFTVKNSNSRILFCRDTFDDPDLEMLEIRCDHLAPNLKGRPRKKRLFSKKGSSQESDSCESTADVYLPPTDFRKSAMIVRPRKDSHKNGILTSDKKEVTKEERAFLQALQKYMKSRKTPIERVPSLGFKQIDIFVFYTYAQKLGGYDQITQKRLWKHLYDQLGGNKGSTSAATCTRRHYERLLLPFERFQRGEEEPAPGDWRRRKSESSGKGDEDVEPPDNTDTSHDMEGQENQKQVNKKLKLEPLADEKEQKALELKNIRPKPNFLQGEKLNRIVSGLKPVSVCKLSKESSEPSRSPGGGGDASRPVLAEQSTNHETIERTLDKVKHKSNSSSGEEGSKTEISDRTVSRRPDQDQLTRGSILAPISHRSTPGGPGQQHPYQQSSALLSPPHLHPYHMAHHPAYIPPHLLTAIPTQAAVSHASRNPVNEEEAHQRSRTNHQGDSPRTDTPLPAHQKSAVHSSHRPSVIQHTHHIKAAHHQGGDSHLPPPHPAHLGGDNHLPPPHHTHLGGDNHLPPPHPAHHGGVSHLPALHPTHQSQSAPVRQALPAHSNHLKRTYPPYLDPTRLGPPIHHISPYNYTSREASQSFHVSSKRPRLPDTGSPQYYLAQMRTLAGDYAAKVSGESPTLSNKGKQSLAAARDSAGQNPSDEQPILDLSMKKKPETGISLESQRTIKDMYQTNMYGSSASENSYRPHSVPRNVHSGAQNMPSPPTAHRPMNTERIRPRSPLGASSQGLPASLSNRVIPGTNRQTLPAAVSNRILHGNTSRQGSPTATGSRAPYTSSRTGSPTATGNRTHYISRQNSPTAPGNTAPYASGSQSSPTTTMPRPENRVPAILATVPTPDLAMAAKTFPVGLSDPNQLLHPAFPHSSYLSPPIVPQGVFSMSPQQMYEAQIRANVAQVAAYEEMVKRGMCNIPGRTAQAPHPPTLIRPSSRP